jgi:hypothetical protein
MTESGGHQRCEDLSAGIALEEAHWHGDRSIPTGAGHAVLAEAFHPTNLKFPLGEISENCVNLSPMTEPKLTFDIFFGRGRGLI